MPKHDCHCQKPSFPAIGVKMMLDVLSVVMRDEVLRHERLWQRATAPLATIWADVHFLERLVKAGWGHVVAACQLTVRELVAGTQVIPWADTSLGNGLNQHTMSSVIEDLAGKTGFHLQLAQGIGGFDVVVTHGWGGVAGCYGSGGDRVDADGFHHCG